MRIILDILTIGLLIAAGTCILQVVLHRVAKDEADTTLPTSLRISTAVTGVYALQAILIGPMGIVLIAIPVTVCMLVDLVKLTWVPEQRATRVVLVFMAAYLFVLVAIQGLIIGFLHERVSLVGIIAQYVSSDQEAMAFTYRKPGNANPALPVADLVDTNEAADVQHMLSEYLNAEVDIDHLVALLDGAMEPTRIEDGIMLPLFTARAAPETNMVEQAPMEVRQPVTMEVAKVSEPEPEFPEVTEKENPEEAEKPEEGPDAKAKLLAEIQALDPQGWQNTRNQLGHELRSVYSMNGIYLAILNDEMVWKGKQVSVEYGGKHFIWTLANLSMHNLEWQPVDIADSKPVLSNKFPRAAKSSGAGTP